MPTIAEVFSAATAAFQAGQSDRAEALLAAILQAQPETPEALHLTAMIRSRQGRAGEAIALLQRAAAIRHSPALLAQLGALLGAAGQPAEALPLFDEALAAEPGQGHWQYNRAVVLQALGRLPEAARAFEAAGAAGWRDGFYSAGRLWLDLRHLPQAVAALERARAQAPDDVPVLTALGLALARCGRQREALACHDKALALAPASAENATLALDNARGLFDFDDQVRRQSQLVAALRMPDMSQDWRLLSSILYRHLYRPLPEDVRKTVQGAFDAGIAAEVGRYPPLPAAPAATDGRIRLGYLSANLKNQPIGQVTLSALAAHDRSRFAVHGFFRDGDPASDPYAARHRAQMEHVHELAGLSPHQAASRIREAGIDVLVYLDGHMDKTGLEIMALRPAPVRIFWLGHAEGIGRVCSDYLIADPIVVPDAETRRHGEAVIRIPACYHCADRHPVSDAPLRRADFGLPEDGFVFCAFNAADKIDGSVFDVWAEILRAVPGSVLWLSLQRSFPDQADGLRAEARRRGVAPERLVFADRVADKAVHLARHRLADLFLDTWTMNASTTALDALLAGLPMVTRRGDGFPSRISNTMLTALGLEDWIRPDVAGYRAAVLALVADPAALGRERSRLAAALARSDLFDPAFAARRLELAYSVCLERQRQGTAPRGLDILR